MNQTCLGIHVKLQLELWPSREEPRAHQGITAGQSLRFRGMHSWRRESLWGSKDQGSSNQVMEAAEIQVEVQHMQMFSGGRGDGSWT